MFGPPVTLRCPRCGTYFSVPAPRTTLPAWVPCPHCRQPSAVLAPRDPAPLFTWEAFPHLYPSVEPPRAPDPRLARVGIALLVVVIATLAIVAGVLLVQGAKALPNHPYTVSGQVIAVSANSTRDLPIAGAIVNVTGENGYRATAVTDAQGRFAFADVPSGGIAVNVTAPAFAPVTVVVFANPVYSSPSAHPTNLTISVVPGTAAAGTTVQESPFADLEQFVATLWSGTSVLSVAVIVAVVGLHQLGRRGKFVWGVAGGMAGATAPVALYLLGTIGLFPLLDDLALVPAVAGLAVTILLATLLAAQEPTVPAE